jgi:N-acetylglucosamine-6-phosphate deacetylase
MKTEAISGRDPSTGQGMRVVYEDQHIVAVEHGLDPGTQEGYLCPGLIDLQVNGYAGYDLNAPGLTVNTVLSLVSTMQKRGVTTFLPTLITAHPDQIQQALAVIAEARRANSDAAYAIPFVHLEGPWIAAEDGPRGAQPRRYVTAPDLNQFHDWQHACDNLIGLVTLSPHFENSAATIAALTQHGVIVSIGHTNATPQQIREAVNAGARLSTHLGNGAASMLPRHPNFIWSQLADDRLMACFIADGHHLPADTFKAMLRAKGPQRSILVSDAAAAGGLPPGIYQQPVGGQVELSPDGRLSLAGTPYLAGAALSLPEIVARAIDMGGIDLATSLQLATRNPGSLIGGRGRLEVGAAADILRFHWQPGASSLAIETVIVRGQAAGASSCG